MIEPRPTPSGPPSSRVRRPASRRSRIAGFGAVAAIGLLLAAGCTGDDGGEGAARRTQTATVAASNPVALLAEPDGSLLYAERLTGDVRRVDADGSLDGLPVAHVDVVGAESDQRGLLGLTRASGGGLYAAWVRASDSRLVVGRIDAPTPEIVWEGPISSDLANGGHLATAPDGRLVIGIGDLQQDRELANDSGVPNRKMLSLDPAGAASQTAEILSTGWNNPFAFTYDDAGVLWVADNTPGDQPERIGRGDRPAAEATDLDTETDGEAAAAALVALGSGRLGRCGFLSGRVDVVDVSDDQPRITDTGLAEPCRTGAAVLSDGRIVTATLDSLVVFTAPQ